MKLVTYIFVEVLQRLFEFPILVNSDSTISRHGSNVLVERIYCHSLNKLLVSIKGLDLTELTVAQTPQDSCIVNGT